MKQKLEELWAKTDFDDSKAGDRFVKLLITEAPQYEIVNVNDPDNIEIPSFYDRELFQKGQCYYRDYRNTFGFSNLVGVVTVLAVESILEILACTNLSSTPQTAYKRYNETILYTEFFYTDSPEDENSLCYQTVKSVRRKHKHGSTVAERKKLGFINQRDMVLTQFSFIGLTIARPEIIGLPYDPENLKALCHFWRVIGNLLGIDDRYNVFEGDLETIIERSEALVQHVFIPAFMNPPERFDEMCFAILDGLRATFTDLNVPNFLFLLNVINAVPGYYLSEEDRLRQLDYLKKYPHYVGNEERLKEIREDLDHNPNACSVYQELGFLQRFRICMMFFLMQKVFVKFNFLRKITNVLFHARYNFLLTYPVVALYRFGKKYAYVDNTIWENYQRNKLKVE